MIVVDASVWIAHFRNEESEQVRRLRGLKFPNDAMVGDLILLECLQGARDDFHAARIEATLRAFPIESMLGEEIALEAAKNYRRLRSRAITPRKTVDLVIATFCIAERAWSSATLARSTISPGLSPFARGCAKPIVTVTSSS